MHTTIPPGPKQQAVDPFLPHPAELVLSVGEYGRKHSERFQHPQINVDTFSEPFTTYGSERGTV